MPSSLSTTIFAPSCLYFSKSLPEAWWFNPVFEASHYTWREGSGTVAETCFLSTWRKRAAMTPRVCKHSISRRFGVSFHISTYKQRCKIRHTWYKFFTEYKLLNTLLCDNVISWATSERLPSGWHSDYYIYKWRYQTSLKPDIRKHSRRQTPLSTSTSTISFVSSPDKETPTFFS